MDFDTLSRHLGYKVFTTEFDVVRDIRDTYTPDDLITVRDFAEGYKADEGPYSIPAGRKSDAVELDKAVAELREVVSVALDETGIDPSDAVIAFLMDNSGSVRQMRPLFARAMVRVVATLDSFGFDTPVVGHTTTLWKGGQSRQKWLDEGKPFNPGRLNDLLLTIYKQPGEPTVEGDLRLYGLASRPNDYKENIDGEALAWLATKLEGHVASAKTLVFVTDGDHPCDDSTLASNPADYLMRHRTAVMSEIVAASDIGLVQVNATSAEIKPTPSAIQCFGGTLYESSDFVKAITSAVDHAIRMTPQATAKMVADAPKIR